MSEAADLARAVRAARDRLIAFVGVCSEDQWTSSPLAPADPRPVGTIVDHVADAYDYLGSFVTRIIRGEPVEVSSDVVDGLNARHAAAPVPTPTSALANLETRGDAFVALIEPLSPHQLASGEGRITITRFAEIAARHADGHRVELETALGLAP